MSIAVHPPRIHGFYGFKHQLEGKYSKNYNFICAEHVQTSFLLFSKQYSITTTYTAFTWY
jgi:hypothetical protein